MMATNYNTVYITIRIVYMEECSNQFIGPRNFAAIGYVADSQPRLTTPEADPQP